MILKRHPVGPDSVGIVDCGNNPTPLLFGGKPFHENIVSRWDEQLVGSIADCESIRLASLVTRPIDEAIPDVARVNKWNRLAPWLSAEKIPCPEIYNSSGRNGQAEIRQARSKLHHVLPDRISIAIRNNMNE